VSNAGAIGLMQLLPTTAAELGANPWDLRDNLLAGARLIDGLLVGHDEDVALAMAAYNAGPTAVTQYGGIPPYTETRAYVARVLEECGPARS
jgi:soluble lytic murein transglycosylase-like protein